MFLRWKNLCCFIYLLSTFCNNLKGVVIKMNWRVEELVKQGMSLRGAYRKAKSEGVILHKDEVAEEKGYNYSKGQWV